MSQNYQCQSFSNDYSINCRRRLDIAIVGAPNAGKSQLLNRFTGSTVAAVSRKRHTTRRSILGVHNYSHSDATTNTETQLVFWDTPGYQHYTSEGTIYGDRELLVAAVQEMESVDYTLLVIDAARTLTPSATNKTGYKSYDPHYKETLSALMSHAMNSKGREEFYLTTNDEEILEEQEDIPSSVRRPKLGIVLNKVDLVRPKTKLLEMAEELGEMILQNIESYLKRIGVDVENDETLIVDLYPTFFYTNALAKDGDEDDGGIQELLKYMAEDLASPSKVWAVEDEDDIMLPIDRVEEIIREKIYRVLHRELPYAVHQVNRKFEEVTITSKTGKKNVLVVHQDLVVRTKSHYNIIAGRNLSTIQKTAERDLRLQKKKLSSQRKYDDIVLHLHLARSKAQHIQ